MISLSDDKSSSRSTDTSSISTAAINSIVMKLKTERNRSSTRSNYYCVWKTFNEFFIRLDAKPETWEERLVLFVAYLIENKKKSTTIKSYVSAIKAVLKDDDVFINENRFILNSLIRACRLNNDKVKTRLPIKKNLLELIVFQLETMFDKQPYLMILYQSLFVTAFYGLLRVGELTSSQHVVKAKDVHIGRNKEKLMFVLHTSKTHWAGEKPQVIKINSLKYNSVGLKKQITSSEKDKQDVKCCPFKLLRKYLSLRRKRKTDSEQFFIFRDGTPVSPLHFRNTLKETLIGLGLDGSVYGTHSLRAGNAVQMLENGISVETIRKLGRWKTNVVYTYLNTW